MPDSSSIKTGAAQVADMMLDRIVSGVWSYRIPGALRLSKEFGVSRTMVAGAVRLLLDSGHISRAGMRKAMRPTGKPVRRSDSGTLVIHDLSAEASLGQARHILEKICSSMPPPASIRRVSSDLKPEALVKLVRESHARNVVIAAHSPVNVDALVDAGFNVVALGTAALGAKAPLVSVDYEFLVRAAFRRAFEAGHTRVCLPLWRRRTWMLDRIRGWVADEYAKAGLRHSPAFDTPVIDDPSAKAMRENIRSLMRHTPPTALVINNAMQWILINSVLAECGIRIPKDVSTILLESMPELAAYFPSQAHFHHPDSLFVRPVLRMLKPEARRRPGKVRMLKATWVPGDSLAPRV